MKIRACYFSPTGATLRVVRELAERLGRMIGAEVDYRSYTLPEERDQMPQWDKDDVVLWATPVYAGRIPNKTVDYVGRALHANGNPAIALVTFGNRAYDNALSELVGLMRDGGMHPVGGAAVVTRHSFSDTLGAGRPDAADLVAIDNFATEVSKILLDRQGLLTKTLNVSGEAHPAKYYTPLNTNNAPAGFLRAKPACDASGCTRCGMCLHVCPMGSIRANDGMPSFDGICIKCQACRRICPTGAIAFTDQEYLSHVAMIEQTFAHPKRSEFFVAEG